MAGDEAVRLRIRVQGTVQGVGFRPFVYRLAARDNLAGLVGNDSDGVFIEVEGAPTLVDRFQTALRAEAPPLAIIERTTTDQIAPIGAPGFQIASSADAGERQVQVAADTATCEDCLRDVADPADRRFGYAFANCADCGPRFTIVRDVPYDRSSTTMTGFTMCGECEREYRDPGDRRFHAQPVCCPDCGPTLRLLDRHGAAPPTEPLSHAVRLLRAGKVVAVKGLGGYHLAADAGSESATASLRARKHREDRPFAVMVEDVAAARRLCHVDETEQKLLRHAGRPIVLLRRRHDAVSGVATSVAPGNDHLGVMLPYTPLHLLLLRNFAGPLVLTSANISDEPTAYADADAFDRLPAVADAFLTHDRPIHVRADDSVARVFRGRPMMIRRSRGFVPQAMRLHRAARRPVLGCGAELKNTFCLAKGDRAVMSGHIGDLRNYATYSSYIEGIDHLRRLLDVAVRMVAHDLHPEYLSTKYAQQLPDVELVAVQHHHAHIASCLVDNGETGPVLGVAFDGLGYGDDGTAWGGEFLLADLVSFERVGHLSPVAMPGGDVAVRQPWRMTAAYLDAAFGDRVPAGLAVAQRHVDDWRAVLSVARSRRHAPLTSSAGRLFDAVAALVGVRDEVNYEGQAAIELEQRADQNAVGGYRAGICGVGPFKLLGVDLITQAVVDLAAGAPTGVVAMRFHRGMARAVVDGCEIAREATGVSTVALSGGVFQNMLLLRLVVSELERHRFRVLTHHRIPPNDGGISIGQVAVAAARDHR